MFLKFWFDFLKFIQKKIFIDGLKINDHEIDINEDILKKVEDTLLLKELILKNIKVKGPYDTKLYNSIENMILSLRGNIDISLLL